MYMCTSLGGLDGSINESLTSSHSVEIELIRCQSGEIRVLHESLTLWSVVVFDEVRQCAVTKPERDSFPLHILLAHTGNNLYNEDMWLQWNSLIRTDLGHKSVLINEMSLFQGLESTHYRYLVIEVSLRGVLIEKFHYMSMIEG